MKRSIPMRWQPFKKIVSNQVMRFFKVQGRLPDNQHGKRAKRSMMTAVAGMQEDWVKKWYKKKVTGILVWDLSAAYDTV